MTILGHSGCGGWAIVISETDEVIFLKRCDKYILNTGFYMPIKVYQTLTLSYDGNQIYFYVNGNLFHSEKKIFQINSQQNLDIGYFS
jgi:hypothetical protein